MTNQELFNNAWQHFVVNGEPLGFNKEEQCCRYRDPIEVNAIRINNWAGVMRGLAGEEGT